MTRNPDSSPGRFRSVLSVLVVATLLVGAGCTGVIGGDDGAGGAEPATDTVPADVDVIAYVDVQGALNDDTLRSVTNEYLSQQAERSYGDPPASVEEMLGDAENSTELDLEGLEAMTMYGRYSESGGFEGSVDDEYGAAVLQTSWSESELVTAIENGSDDELEEGSYAGATLYESNEDDSYLGVLGDGRFVAGSESAVKDALDVEAGNADAANGEVRSAFEDTRDGYVRFAGTVQDEQVPTEQLDRTGAVSNANIFTEVEVLSGAQYVSDDQVGMELTMTVGDEETALNLRDVTRGAISWGRNTLNASESGQQYAGFIDRDSLSVEQSGNDVTVVSENGADEIESLIQTAYSSNAA